MDAPTVTGHIRLYRYLSAKWALKTIETGELKVSRLAELNDPFEFMPALKVVNPIFPHSVVDEFMKFLVNEFNPQWGIICLSEQIFDPVNCNTLIFLGLSHEHDIRAAKQSLFLPETDVVYLDRLGVGEGIVKIKGRVGACYVRFPLASLGV